MNIAADATALGQNLLRLNACRERIADLEAAVLTRGDALLARWSPKIGREEFVPGARNLARYLALRQADLTALQDELSSLGLSSLGRAESRIAPTLSALHATLEVLCGKPAQWPEPAMFKTGEESITAAQGRYFGSHPGGRSTRIMVTLPSDAAGDPAIACRLVEAGASCFRINCAHDGPEAWAAMIGHVRDAAAKAGRDCPVVMDVAGPKIRIVSIESAKAARLFAGDRFRLLRPGASSPDKLPAIAISHPDIFVRLAEGSRVWIDDGKIGARVAGIDAGSVLLEVEVAREKGVKLKLEKGVNFPSLELEIPPLGPKDLDDLDFVARNADVVGFSFVQRVDDVLLMQSELAARRGPGAPAQALMLKIETPLAVRNLPELLVAAGSRNPVSVMIARGDLAMEVGLERLSELQEEILWLCEAAHVPVVWATQVLENLMKTGVPSRAEVTDAAMGQRAECVMLNKGPHVEDAVKFLSGVLRRMDRHQFKKSARLSALTAWSSELL